MSDIEMLNYPRSYGMNPVPKKLPAWKLNEYGTWCREGVAWVEPSDDERWDGYYNIARVELVRPERWRVPGSGVGYGRHNCDLRLVELGHELEDGIFPAPAEDEGAA